MKFEKNKNYISYNPLTRKIVTEKAKKYNIVIDDEIFSMLIAEHTENFGNIKQILVNKHKKSIFVDRGVIYLSIRQLAKLLKTTKERIVRLFKELTQEGVLMKINFIGSQIKYAWTYIYSTVKNKQGGLSKKIKNNLKNKSAETNDMENHYNREPADLQLISEKLAKRGILTPRYIKEHSGSSLQPKSGSTNYYINIKTKKDKEKKILNTCGVSEKRDEKSKNSTSQVNNQYPFACGNQNKEGKNAIDSDLKSALSGMFSIPEDKPMPKAYFNKPVERKVRQLEPETPERSARKKMTETFEYIFGIACVKPFKKFIKTYTETRAIELFFNHGQNSKRSVIINAIAEVLPEYEYLIKTKMNQI